MSTLVGEKFGISSSHIPKNVLNLYTVGEIFEFSLLKWLKMSTLIGENFEIYSHQIPINVFKCSTMVWEILRFTLLKCRKRYSNCLPSLEKFFENHLAKIAKNAFKFSNHIFMPVIFFWRMSENSFKHSLYQQNK